MGPDIAHSFSSRRRGEAGPTKLQRFDLLPSQRSNETAQSGGGPCDAALPSENQKNTVTTSRTPGPGISAIGIVAGNYVSGVSAGIIVGPAASALRVSVSVSKIVAAQRFSLAPQCTSSVEKSALVGVFELK
jgi:hypothetical protein